MKEQITFDQYNKDIELLAGRIIERGKKYQSLYGIPRGGYYVAIQLSGLLGIPVVNKPTLSTLIVDDICDTGSTMGGYTQYDCCAVYVRESSKYMVTYYGVVKNTWLLFPDEKETGIEDHIRRILSYIGENPNREGLIGTPDRIARMCMEIFRGYDAQQKPKITTFDNGVDGIVYNDMVIDKGDFYSCCEHHMMPFFGHYCFAYIPNPKGKILGISKIGRVVDYCSARLQIQERLVHDIVDMLADALGSENPPQGIALVMTGEHLCKTMRGAKKKGTMTSSYMTGEFLTNPALRAEFLNLCGSM